MRKRRRCTAGGSSAATAGPRAPSSDSGASCCDRIWRHSSGARSCTPHRAQGPVRQSAVCSAAMARRHSFWSQSLDTRTSMWSQGRRSSRSRWRNAPGTSQPTSSIAPSHAGKSRYSDDDSRRAPFRKAASTRSAARRSARARSPSMKLVSGSWRPNLMCGCFLKPCSRMRWRRRISSKSIWAAHWNGVNGLGTKVETPVTIRARRSTVCARSRTRAQRSTMASRSSSHSVGRPIMK